MSKCDIVIEQYHSGIKHKIRVVGNFKHIIIVCILHSSVVITTNSVNLHNIQGNK